MLIVSNILTWCEIYSRTITIDDGSKLVALIYESGHLFLYHGKERFLQLDFDVVNPNLG